MRLIIQIYGGNSSTGICCLIGDLNAAFAELTKCFPYQAIQIESPSASLSSDWERGQVIFHLASNATLGKGLETLSYQNISREAVEARFKKIFGARQYAQLRSVRDRMSSYIGIGHTLKNIISLTGHSNALDEIAGLRRNLPTYAERSVAINDERVTKGLGAAARSLHLFNIVEGMGHLIRLAGTTSGDFDWSKFTSWIPPQDAAVPSKEEILGQYFQSIEALLKSFCYGMQWQSFVIEAPEIERSVTWDGEAPEPLDIRSLHFPPFKAASEASYIYLFSLAEPLANAVRALLTTDLPAVAGQVPLTITIRSSDSHLTSVTVEITNLSSRSVVKRLSGWETTAHLLKELGLGEFESTYDSQPCGENLHRVTFPLRYEPHRLIERIRKAG
jgi:hypothetical protein